MPPDSNYNIKVRPVKRTGPGVRAFRVEDLPGIVHLLGKIFPRSPEATLDIKEDIISELLLNNPWHDERLPSLVYESGEGKITGFLGVAPRPMRINDRPVTATISYNLMVDPESRSSLAGISLVKAYLSGPQDLSFADSATDTSRKLWESLGGITVPLYSLYWKHPLRPVGFAIHHLQKRSRFGLLLRASEPAGRFTDWMVDRFWKAGRDAGEFNGNYWSQETEAEELTALIGRFSEKASLAPVYTTETLSWLLNLAARTKRFGELKKEVIYGKNNKLAGWFIYYKNPGGVSEVLQIKSVPGKEKQVLMFLLQKAREQGAVGVAGRLEPDWFTVFPDAAFGFYMPGRVWMLAHSANRDILRAFKGGDAFITRIEGDMWLL